MGFISGLRGIFKRYIYASIILAFIFIWILILVLRYLYFDLTLQQIIIFLGGCLIVFSIILFFVSFFKPVDGMGKIIVVIALVIALFVASIFREDIFFRQAAHRHQ